MKKVILAVALMALFGVVSAQSISPNSKLQAFTKEPVSGGGFWINPKTGQIMSTMVNSTNIVRSLPMAFMTQPDQAKFVADLKAAGIEYQDNGKGFAVIK
jgi:hypothetical protein